MVIGTKELLLELALQERALTLALLKVDSMVVLMNWLKMSVTSTTMTLKDITSNDYSETTGEIFSGDTT